MFSHSMKEMVNDFCRDFIKESKLFELGRKNGLTKYHLATYLKNIEFLFSQNAADLYHASFIHQDRPVLSSFFKHKWIEERGHDAWARNDLKKLDVSSEILDEMKALTSFLTKTMKTSPHCYLSYLYFAEYMTIILGPIWLDLLNQNMNTKREDVTALGNHIELDVDHYQEVGDFIDELNLSELQRSQISDFYNELAEKYNAFFNSLTGDLYESVRSREVTHKLSTST